MAHEGSGGILTEGQGYGDSMTAAELFFKLKRLQESDVLRTPGPGCPACIGFRVHTPEEQKLHPYMRHGYATGKMGGGGAWTHQDLVPRELVKVK